ncbi:valine--tRNA ligase [Candidatus Peribacteria bacterium]|nr:MAG: valine--tRNA ligase [Candidatus Peribacteria bacterium]
MWEDSGAFKADANSTKESFTISMPPPNATGQLHLGHAVMLALEDIFTRFARMQGKEALWVPGTDHAAIATENVVIKKLKDEGMKDPRKELGREALVGKIAEFVENSKTTIRGQVRKMGSSCDWSRERYTFEPSLNRCVNEVFKKMYEDGLIYRGHRIVNWDPKLQTTVSDDEVEWKEETIPFYTFQYGPFQISTARPETKFGDKYVVMHPDDERYAQYKHGDTFEAEWINGPVRATVIKDTAVDPAFGTGVMTITPWHDTADFEIAERHGLEKEQVIDYEGKLLPIAEEFAGMKIEVARPLIVEKLQSKGLVVKTEEGYVHNKAVNQRGGGTIEPQIKLQWFMDVNKEVVDWKNQKMSLKQIMHDVVHHGDIQIIPERFNKTYFHWIDNLRDWCVSRQIWWGHRIPVWYRGDEIYTGVTAPEGDGWEQDTDTLDTWFSSAMWTWSTLIDPALALDPSLTLNELLERSPDFKKFHPTSVMETGYDILFFWVARMILMTTYATGQIPFKTVYLHGLIRTRDGAKMSKSHPETMIDPLDMISKYGADALRLSMIVGQSPGADSRLYEEKIAGYRNFINKLWNASRFVLMQCEAAGIDPKSIESLPDVSTLSLADRAILHASEILIEDVTKGMETYSLSETGEKLYSFTWDYFCDWYLELSKGTANHAVLVHVLRRLYKLLHPYCPFITEELWAQIKPANAGMLMAEAWPVAKEERKDQAAFGELQILIDVITSIRRLRTEQAVEPAKEISVTIVTGLYSKVLEDQESHIRRMGKIGNLTISTDAQKLENVASVFLADIEVHLSLEGLIDVEKEKASLSKEKENLEKFVAGIEAKLGNEQFVARAPEALVAEQKGKLEEARGKLQKIAERLQGL